MNSFKHELNYILTEQGYHKLSLILAVLVAVIFTTVFSNNYIQKAPVAVIDLDNSRFSRSFIDELNTSPYIKINLVTNMPQDPEQLMYHDANYAVVYIPEGFEKNRYKKSPNNIGVFYDNINNAQSANLRTGFNEIIGSSNAAFGAVQLRAMGLNSRQIQGAVQNISLKERLLFNPVSAPSNLRSFGFLFFFGTMFLVFATIILIPRLKAQHLFQAELEKGFGSLLGRIAPYIIFYTVSITAGLGIIKIIGDLTFRSNYLLLLFTVVLLGLASSLMAVLVGWGAKNPGAASGRMIFFIPGGFILGGISLPMGLLPLWAQAASNIFPLVWGYRLLRDIMFRGASFRDCLWEYGAFILFILLIGTALYLRCYWERRNLFPAKQKLPA